MDFIFVHGEYHVTPHVERSSTGKYTAMVEVRRGREEGVMEVISIDHATHRDAFLAAMDWAGALRPQAEG